jgi:hypothetical protein
MGLGLAIKVRRQFQELAGSVSRRDVASDDASQFASPVSFT